MADDTFTIATFNVNSIRQRHDAVLEWLAMNDPDALCLQETKVTDDLFPREEFVEAGYHVLARGMKAYNGVALLTRVAPEEVKAGFDDDAGPADEARLIAARVGGVAVLNTYVPQGQEVGSEKYAYKLDWFKRVRAFLERHFRPDEPLVWVGDLNVALEDMDVYDPKTLAGHVCFNPEVQTALREVMEWGLQDVFRKHRPDPGEFSFFDYRLRGALERNRGWRIDHILATPALANLSEDAWIDREPREGEKPSDHTPVVARFRRPA